MQGDEAISLTVLKLPYDQSPNVTVILINAGAYRSGRQPFDAVPRHFCTS